MLVESHQTISKIPFLQSAFDQHNLWLKTLPSDHFSSSDIPVFPFFPMEYFCANLDSPFFPIKSTPNGWTLSVVSTLESDYEFADFSPHPQVFSGTFIYRWVPVTSPLRVFISHHCPMPCSLLTPLEAILSKPIPLHHEPMQVLQNLIFLALWVNNSAISADSSSSLFWPLLQLPLHPLLSSYTPSAFALSLECSFCQSFSPFHLSECNPKVSSFQVLSLMPNGE